MIKYSELNKPELLRFYVECYLSALQSLGEKEAQYQHAKETWNSSGLFNSTFAMLRKQGAIGAYKEAILSLTDESMQTVSAVISACHKSGMINIADFKFNTISEIQQRIEIVEKKI